STQAEERPLRVLIADDCSDIAYTEAMLVRLWGHEAAVAADGRAALDLARAVQPDVMLLDLGMPGLSGFELAQRIRHEERLRQATLIAVTGYGDPAVQEQSRAAGFDFHLVKPVDPALLERVLRVIHESQQLWWKLRQAGSEGRGLVEQARALKR